MTCTMRRPTPDERDKITRCRKQIFEVERLGLLMEQAETLLPARDAARVVHAIRD